MFSKEESKQLRHDFWTFFGKRYHRKWTLYDTKIKDVNLKFSMEKPRALVSIDIEHEDEIFRHYYYDKLLSLKTIMQEDISPDLVFDKNYILESGKEICRVYVYKEPAKITKKTDWPEIYEFFHENMDKLETFFWEYADFIEE
jgi:hypothetical protein